MPGKHHTAWALEKDDVLYWFDAGSGCGNTAHLMGLDVRKIRRIFISHSHIDHTGGLPHLLSVVRKRIERDPDGPGAEIEINALLGTPGSASSKSRDWQSSIPRKARFHPSYQVTPCSRSPAAARLEIKKNKKFRSGIPLTSLTNTKT